MTEAELTTYRVVFKDNRIGRTRTIEPLIARVRDADDLAKLIYAYARPHLRSRDVRVVADLEKMTGSIFCGFNNGAQFTIERHVDRDAVRDAAVEQVVRVQHAYAPAPMGPLGLTVYAAHCCCGWTGVDRYYTEDSARARTVEHVEAVVAEALAQAGAQWTAHTGDHVHAIAAPDIDLTIDIVAHLGDGHEAYRAHDQAGHTVYLSAADTERHGRHRRPADIVLRPVTDGATIHDVVPPSAMGGAR